jgi:hypothetical protein
VSRLSARSFAQSLTRINGNQPLKAAQSLFSVQGVDPKDFTRPMSRRALVDFYNHSFAQHNISKVISTEHPSVTVNMVKIWPSVKKRPGFGLEAKIMINKMILSQALTQT